MAQPYMCRVCVKKEGDTTASNAKIAEEIQKQTGKQFMPGITPSAIASDQLGMQLYMAVISHPDIVVTEVDGYEARPKQAMKAMRKGGGASAASKGK